MAESRIVGQPVDFVGPIKIHNHDRRLFSHVRCCVGSPEAFEREKFWWLDHTYVIYFKFGHKKN